MIAQDEIPVVLFAYARTAHLVRALESLRRNAVPRLIVYADGPKSAAEKEKVATTRAILRAIDWCAVQLEERTENLGLGRNILAGVTDVAAQHEAFIVWEDDLIAVPGAYAWVCAALRHYAEDGRVMSVTAWTHPRVTPPNLGAQPYLDGRAECWVWGTWSRAWRGMPDETALQKLAVAVRRGVPPDAYGSDLPRMAAAEERQNIWAVRWLYHHFQHGGLCVRPPWSMVEHIGLDATATNAQHATAWMNPPLRKAPPIPADWPSALEHSECRARWVAATPPVGRGVWQRARARLGAPARAILPKPVVAAWRRSRLPRLFEGNYAGWSDAQRASRGYDDPAIFQKTVAASRAVRDGLALWERDTVLFQAPAANDRLVGALRAIANQEGGRLHLIDFGGALGSTWWQHRAWLADIASLRWCVVEQRALVEIGQREFSTAPLSFHETIEDCRDVDGPAAILLSSVLPYLEHPHALLHEIATGPFRHVVIDRTGFVAQPKDRLTVQHVPPEIYDASYPCWFFNRSRLLAALGPTWTVAEEWANDDAVNIKAYYRGMRLRRM